MRKGKKQKALAVFYKILITLKGATDVVLTHDKCLTYKTNTGEIKELTDDIRNHIIQRQEQMGKNGQDSHIKT